jgi:hypothetical protein
MSHPRYHAWLFSQDAIECARVLGELRVLSVPPMGRWIPSEWLDTAIDIAMDSQDAEGYFRYSPEEVAQQVWEILKPTNTHLFREE